MTEIVTNELYGGEVTINFYPKSHRYKNPDTKQWIPSATTITGKLDKSRALIPWAVGCTIDKMKELMEGGQNFTSSDIESMLFEAKNAHTEKKESAATVGSVLHDYAETTAKVAQGENIDLIDFLKEETRFLTDEEKEKVMSAVKAFEEWSNTVKLVDTEFVVYSKKHDHVGICDGMVNRSGSTYLLDYKTSKGIYVTHIVQLASYVYAYQEEHREKLDGAMLVHIDKNTGEIKEYMFSMDQMKQAYEGMFLPLLKVYRTEKELLKILKELN